MYNDGIRVTLVIDTFGKNRRCNGHIVAVVKSLDGLYPDVYHKSITLAV
jgi:hypothetical protein